MGQIKQAYAQASAAAAQAGLYMAQAQLAQQQYQQGQSLMNSPLYKSLLSGTGGAAANTNTNKTATPAAGGMNLGGLAGASNAGGLLSALFPGVGPLVSGAIGASKPVQSVVNPIESKISGAAKGLFNSIF